MKKNCKIKPRISKKYNKIPFCSTYWYKPNLDLKENLSIEYYCTDYNQSEYCESIDIYRFTVIIQILNMQNVLKEIVLYDVSSGNHKYTIDLDLDIGEYYWTIQVKDKYGRFSPILTNAFMVYDKSAYESDIINKTYEVSDEDLIAYNINKNGNYGSELIIPIPEGTEDIYNYLKDYSRNINVESKKYICFASDTNKDNNPDYKVNNWIKWSEGDYNSYVKYSSDYDFDLVELESVNNALGLQKLINDKISDGYKKIVLPQNSYFRITSSDCIEIYADNFILDCNNSTFKTNKILNTNDFVIMNLIGNNSHVLNANFEGCLLETDYSIWKDENSAINYFEKGHGIAMGLPSKYSSYENCTIRYITGYGIISYTPKKHNPPFDSQGFKWNNYYSTMPLLNNNSLWKQIDIIDGVEVPSKNKLTYDFIDISYTNKFPIISINKYLGYQNRSGGSWDFKCHFYDENKNYLGYKQCTQYRKFIIEKNAKYIRITINSGTNPKEGTYNILDLKICSQIIPQNCYLKNINVNNVRCVGMCPFGENSWCDNLNITKSGFAEAHQLIDAEDTWESLYNFTIKNSTIKDGIDKSYLLLCSGINTVIENSDIEFVSKSRARHTVLRNNNILNLSILYENTLTTGYPRLYNNTLGTANLSNNMYGHIGSNDYNQNVQEKEIIIDYNQGNKFIEGVWGFSRNKCIRFKNFTFDFANRNKATVVANYDTCTIKNLNYDLVNCNAYNCIFENCNCKITNIHNTFYYSTKFIDCTFKNCNIINDTDLDNTDLFINCIFI